MKLVTKQGFKFATGMFWQIPDEGKRKVNLTKLVRDTKHNLFCQIKSINLTWGFCRKEELHGEKKVASLGKFIIEASNLSAEYANSIICFKFKNAGEVDDDGGILNFDLYGYIVLLNGTICPDEGEYVAKIDMVRQSIYEQASKHDVETLYLPVDVSGQFFSIFEILYDAYNNDKLLIEIIHNISVGQKRELDSFLKQHFPKNATYLELIKNSINFDLNSLRQLINEQDFVKELNSEKEKNLKYLIPGIVLLPYTSDEIYWQDEVFKKNHTKSLLKPISNETYRKYKFILGICVVIALGAIVYNTFIKEELLIVYKKPIVPIVPRPMAIEPIQLINTCLANHDQYFKDLSNWSLTSIRCNSLNGTFTFVANSDTTLLAFETLIGKNGKNVKFTNHTGIYTETYNIRNTLGINHNLSKEAITNSLQQAAIDYGLKVIFQAGQQQFQTIKFSINSKQSPVFLLSHHILDNVRLREIGMDFDKSSGYYNWTIQGEF